MRTLITVSAPCLAMVCGLAFCLSPATAAVIFEDSFEAGLADGGWTDWLADPAVGWAVAGHVNGAVGNFNPVPSQPQPLHDPNLADVDRNAIYIQGETGAITTGINVAWAPNTQYSVQVDYWANTNAIDPEQLTFNLLDSVGIVASNNPTLLLNQNVFLTANVLSFVTGDVAPTGNVALQILTNGVGQYLLDHVVVTAVPVPEPSSVTILGMGVAALCASRRRRRQR